MAEMPGFTSVSEVSCYLESFQIRYVVNQLRKSDINIAPSNKNKQYKTMQTELQTQMIGYFLNQCTKFTNLFNRGGNAKLQKVLGSELYYKQCNKYWTYKLSKINAMSVDELNNLNYLVRYAIELKLYGKMSLKQFVESRFATYYQSANCDRYGQLNVVDCHSIFPTNIVHSTQDCIDYLVNNDIVNVGTYGYAYGTYKAFSPWSIKDAKIKQICEYAYANNTSRKNCNNW